MEPENSNVPLAMDLKSIDTLDSPFHQNLLTSLSDITEQLQQLAAGAETRMSSAEENDFLRGGVWELVENYKFAMSELQAFLNTLEIESRARDAELVSLGAKRQELLAERDILIEKGHELNCRLGYNALERKLDETFTSIEKYTSEKSAKCFRDEAEESLKRTNDLVRIANMRACQTDRDMFKEMEKIANLFENYERDREHYVKELDLFSDVKRQRISAWLSESRTEGEREQGENVLDFLNLSQRQRHMEAQVIKNALRMYSFNASLSFDREDNLKMMEDLSSLKAKVNSLSGVTVTLPRATKARTDLTSDGSNHEEDGKAGGDANEDEEIKGKGLHRCPRKVNLATDPITDPEILVQLESALRWEEKDGGSTSADPQEISTSDQHENIATPMAAASCSSLTQAEAKGADSICGDVCFFQQECTVTEGNNAKMESDGQQRNSHSTHNFLRHIESPTVLPNSAERQIAGLVRKKHGTRAVGSLTNVQDMENEPSSHKATKVGGETEERDTRSQGSEPATRPGKDGINFVVSPENIVTGLTQYLTANCTFSQTSFSQISSLTSIDITKANGNLPGVAEERLASIDITDANQVKKPDSLNAISSGHIDANGQSYLSIEWSMPSTSENGVYHCNVYGVDQTGHPVLLSRTVDVTSGSTTPDVLTETVKVLLSRFDQLEQRVSVLESEVSSLKADKHLLATNVSTLQNFEAILEQRMGTSANTMFEVSSLYDGRKYYKSKHVFTDVDVAEAICEVYGGYLAEIDDAKELDFVTAFMQSFNDTSKTLVGATDELEEGVWRFRHSGKNVTFTNWASGEPRADYFDCMILKPYFTPSTMSIYQCYNNDYRAQFLCEIPQSIV